MSAILAPLMSVSNILEKSEEIIWNLDITEREELKVLEIVED